MMDLMDGLLSRRSVRKYTDQPVSEEMVELMMRAAMAAPTAGNQQPWRFSVISERRLLDEIPKFHEHAQMLYGAPMAIMVSCDMELAVKHPHLWQQDCSAAVQNVLLAAHAQGLGAVWIGVYPVEARVEALARLMEVPSNVIPFALVSLGYPAEEKGASNRYDPTRVTIAGRPPQAR
jgi:nitroreductase